MGTNNNIKKRTLIVIDQPNIDLDEKVRVADNEAIDLLTIDCSPAQITTRLNLNILDTEQISAKAEQEARDFYVKLIKELPEQKVNGQSLADLLTWGKQNLWWYLDISEKSIWLDRTVHRLYALARFVRVCQQKQYDDILFFVKDSLLRQAMAGLSSSRKSGPWFICRYLLVNLRMFIKMSLQLLLYWLAKIKPAKNIAANSIAFFSVYPSWWQNAFSAKATDKFFQSIPEILAKDEKVYNLLWVRPGWRTFFKNRQGFIQFLKQRNGIVLGQFLKLSDLLGLFSLTRLRKFTQAAKLSAKLSVGFKGIDVSSFIHDALIKSLTSVSLPEWLLLDKALRRCRLEQFKALFFRLEFQPLERALLFNTRDRTKTFGFQHSALSRNFLNYAFCPNQLSQTSMPLPDHILTSGQIGFDYMKEAGFPEKRISVSGALRQRPLFKYLNNRPAKQALRRKYFLPADKKIVLVATTALFNETMSMLNDLIKAVGKDSGNYHLIVKCHPNVRAMPGFVSKINPLFKQNGSQSSYDIFIECPIPLYDYILLSDVVLSTGGTVSLETMLLGGVGVIIYNSIFQFNHSPLLAYPESVMTAADHQSLAAALSKINQQSSGKNWAKPLRDMFGDVSQDPQMSFIDTVKNITGDIGR